jgi:hypothetical protein
MSTNDQINVIFSNKSFNNFLTKNITYSSIIVAPFIFYYIKLALVIMIWRSWVWPEQITKYSCFRNFSRSLNLFYLIQILHIFAKSPMHTKNFIFYQSWYRKHIKCCHKFFPKADIVSFLTFFIKSIYFSNIFTFMVTS